MGAVRRLRAGNAGHIAVRGATVTNFNIRTALGVAVATTLHAFLRVFHSRHEALNVDLIQFEFLLFHETSSLVNLHNPTLSIPGYDIAFWILAQAGALL